MGKHPSVVQLPGRALASFFNIEFVGVDLNKNEEKRNEDGSKNKTYKPKKTNTNDNSKTSDQRMYIANAFQYYKPEQVIYCTNNAKSVYQHNEPFAAMAIGK